MTPFICFDNEMITSRTWPDEKLKVAGERIDPATVGKIHEYRKMPLLSVQFRDNAVFQAGRPVTIWGSTRNYGEWQSGPEEGDCTVHFEFGEIRKTINVTPEMVEWQVTLPPMQAGPTPYTLKVRFTIDGELVHERTATDIVFGDVWYVAAPPCKFEIPEVKPSGRIVRMLENQSKREGKDAPSRYSVCVSRTPKNRFASYWKDASGVAATLGNRISAKTGRPVRHHLYAVQNECSDQELDRPLFPQGCPESDGRLQDGGQQVLRQPLLPRQCPALYQGMEAVLE